MIVRMRLPASARIAEVGVGLGILSQFILEHLQPSLFVAIDSFRLHSFPVLWGQPAKVLFGGLTHREYYERRLAAHEAILRTDTGDSADCLAAYPDHHFDLIYLDADHSYEAVSRDIAQAVKKVAAGGLLVFNDYVLQDHGGTPYGVVPAVNELLVRGGWQIAGFALQNLMYCDVALRRVAA